MIARPPALEPVLGRLLGSAVALTQHHGWRARGRDSSYTFFRARAYLSLVSQTRRQNDIWCRGRRSPPLCRTISRKTPVGPIARAMAVRGRGSVPTYLLTDPCLLTQGHGIDGRHRFVDPLFTDPDTEPTH